MRSHTKFLAAAALISLSSAAWAQTTAPTPAPAGKTMTPQQQRMAQCSSANKGKTGDDYKSSVSACLKGDAAPAKTLTPQQQRMKDCNAQAGQQTLTGDKRKTFMSTCLKSTN